MVNIEPRNLADQAILRLDLARAADTPGTYAARIEFRAPGAQAAELLADGAHASIQLPLDALRDADSDDSYTRILSQAVFGDPQNRLALVRASSVADTSKASLRIRLALAERATELHGLRWELLGDPLRGFLPFARGERTSLARWSQPHSRLTEPRRHQHRLRSLALIANPRRLEDGALALPPIDVSSFSTLVNQELDSTRIRLLTSERARLATLGDELHDGCEILLLACHGAFVDGRAHLYFEGPNQQAEIVDARVLAEHIAKSHTAAPRLAILASCHSLGDGSGVRREDGLFFSSLASQLAAAGVAAVVGMQGMISIDTARTFLIKLLQLALSGNQIEAAVAGARQAIERQDDWWTPALLLAVDDGVLWSGGEAKPYRNWHELLRLMRKGQCTPILGPDAIEPLSNRRLARYFGTKLRRPITRGHRGVPRLAQQLKVENLQTRPGNELENFYRNEVIGSGGDDDGSDIVDALSRWARVHLAEPVFNSYRELARLKKVPVFITTNPDNLLTDALIEEGRQPQVLVCPWKGRMDDVQAIPTEVEYSEERPVVYHLFGHLSDPQSVVLTEDDFFDHLIWLSVNNRLIPPSLISRFAESSLMFLGFHLEDWEFRILLRSITKLPGAAMLTHWTHIAVQLDPTGLSPDQLADAELALEEFFSKTEVRLDIYWGTVEDFLRELRRQLRPASERTFVAGRA